MEITIRMPRWTKWALGLGVPAIALILLTGFAIGQWTKPNDFAPGQVIRAADMNTNFDTLFTAVNDLDSRAAVPGTLMWWFCPHAGGCSPTDVPAGWVVADGDTVTGQPTSPLNGVTLPNLIDSVVMGASFADIGSTGGENTSDLSHTHGVGTLVTDVAGAHNHIWARKFQPQPSAFELRTHDVAGALVTPGIFQENPVGSGTTSRRAFVEGTHPQLLWTDIRGEHTHTIMGETATDGLSNHDNRPAYVGLLPLIKL